MQSLAVHGSRSSRPGACYAAGRHKAAIKLIRNILTECSWHQNKQQPSSSSLLVKLRQLISESMLSEGRRCPAPIAASSTTPHRTFFTSSSFNLINRLLLPYTTSFLASASFCSPMMRPFLVLDKIELAVQAAAAKALHLITAYSGYSKEYLNATYNTNIKSTRIDISDTTTSNNSNNISSSRRNSGLATLGGNRKGCIGDDAWFIAKQTHADFLGVADGVGGWHEFGIDPSKFSFNLMKTCKRLVEQDTSANKTITSKTPIELLEQSYQTLVEDKNNAYLIGSSTACILLFHHDTNFLHACNLGDSGFVVVRANRIIHRSQEQQHYFNSPYQIAILPPPKSAAGIASAAAKSTPSNAANVSSSTSSTLNSTSATSSTTNQREQEERSDDETLICDSPDAASSSSLELKEGDFIVMGTDGLWDNLNESHLLVEISNIKSYLIDDLQKAANNIARKAIELALDPDYISPFAKAARKYGINISGGKPDDITVILARVSKQQLNQQDRKSVV